ncbi:MAG: hypothetical protein RIB45_04415 [Marivibrio sp.]|uniref:hypothetical protein n=1 Tax=Marivibrio sp. TaxID=2039719 RepID=UPI0032EC6FBB
MRRTVFLAAAALALPLILPARAEEPGYGAGGASVGRPGVSTSVGGPGADGPRAAPYSAQVRPDEKGRQRIDDRIDETLESSRRLRERAQQEAAGLTPRPAD